MRDYANTSCPYCSASLDPLPKAKKRCPSCGQPIWVRSGPDGLTYLLQEVDLPILEQAWQEVWDKKHDAEDREFIAQADALGRESYERTIADARECGFTHVEYMVSDDACAECRSLSGRPVDIRVAPPLPIANCQNEFCRCGVVAVVDYDESRAMARELGLR